MAKAVINLQKESGGIVKISPVDGIGITEVTVPESGELVTKEYVDTGAGVPFVSNDNRVKTALNASGDAPIYACRAWVNFNGTGTVAIRASENVSSVTDGGTGIYTVNFTTAMPDVNYSVAHSTRIPASSGKNTLAVRMFGYYSGSLQDVAPLTTSFTLGTCVQGANNNADGDFILLSVFR